MSDVYAQLTALDITLPPVAVPAAAYVPFVQTGNLIFLSGHIAKRDGQVWTGQLGKDMDTATGDLNRIKRVVKVMSLVNSTPEYTEQHLVTNGCSELIGQVFGNTIGAHARSAFGVAQLPLGACVEIEMIVEV